MNANNSAARLKSTLSFPQSAETPTSFSFLKRRFEQLWAIAIRNLVSSEPDRFQVQQTRRGWQIYQPLSHQTFTFDSEAEAIAWIEQQFKTPEQPSQLSLEVPFHH